MWLQVVQGDQSGKDPPLATPAADVWALGVIAYEVLCGRFIALFALCTCLLHDPWLPPKAVAYLVRDGLVH